MIDCVWSGWGSRIDRPSSLHAAAIRAAEATAIIARLRRRALWAVVGRWAGRGVAGSTVRMSAHTLRGGWRRARAPDRSSRHRPVVSTRMSVTAPPPPAGTEASRPVDHDGNPLCVLSVHAHPDDEASKGASTMALYHEEGVAHRARVLHRRRGGRPPEPGAA